MPTSRRIASMFLTSAVSFDAGDDDLALLVLLRAG